MIKYTTEKKRKVVTNTYVLEARCNKCGSVKFCESLGVYDLHEFKVRNGWCDKYDGEEHTFDLCDGCYVKLIKSFKIPVDIENIHLL